jgi:hypothetical protein
MTKSGVTTRVLIVIAKLAAPEFRWDRDQRALFTFGGGSHLFALPKIGSGTRTRIA